MKNIFFKSFALAILFFTAALTVSCDTEGEDLKKYYKNQNHSEELKGWWRKIDREPDHGFASKILFENHKVLFYSYNIHTHIYDTSYDYWYNDATKIYFLTEPDGISKPDERSNSYILNSSKDTLKIYAENPPYIYVKDTGL